MAQQMINVVCIIGIGLKRDAVRNPGFTRMGCVKSLNRPHRILLQAITGVSTSFTDRRQAASAFFQFYAGRACVQLSYLLLPVR